MKSKNPNSGIYEADSSRTLDLNGGNPNCNQGGMVVVGFAEGQFGTFREDESAGTVKASGGNLGGGSETLIVTRSERYVPRMRKE